MTKPIVHFGYFNRWVSIRASICASLSDIEGHPRLGQESVVRTSAVVAITYGNREGYERYPVEIETLNTIYRLKEVQ